MNHSASALITPPPRLASCSRENFLPKLKSLVGFASVHVCARRLRCTKSDCARIGVNTPEGFSTDDLTGLTGHPHLIGSSQTQQQVQLVNKMSNSRTSESVCSQVFLASNR